VTRAVRQTRSAADQGRATVFVVDDDVSVRESLELLIRSADLQPHTFATGGEFLAHSHLSTPGCLLLDVGLPDLNGLELQTRLTDRRLEMPIIFISGQGDIPMTVRAMKAGALDFLTKPLSGEAVLAAIAVGLERSRAALARAAEVRSLRERYQALSRREQEVMTLVASGLLNKEVGGELGISEITVKTHRGRVMRKMKADSLAHLVNMVATLQLGRHPSPANPT
jgi:FixJ family two-component response regulator